MPRKSSGEKLEEEVSTKISRADFMVLEKYAKILYNENKLRQPTVSRFAQGNYKNVGKWRREEQEKAPATLKLVPFRKHHKNMNNQETIHINL